MTLIIFVPLLPHRSQRFAGRGWWRKTFRIECSQVSLFRYTVQLWISVLIPTLLQEDSPDGAGICYIDFTGYRHMPLTFYKLKHQSSSWLAFDESVHPLPWPIFIQHKVQNGWMHSSIGLPPGSHYSHGGGEDFPKGSTSNTWPFWNQKNYVTWCLGEDRQKS